MRKSYYLTPEFAKNLVTTSHKIDLVVYHQGGDELLALILLR